MSRFPKPVPPESKDTRGIMIPKTKAKQPKLVVPSKVIGKPVKKKIPKKNIKSQGMGRRTLNTD